MADNTFQYVTRPSAAGNAITTMPKYRGTKTQAQVYAEVTTCLGATPPTVENVTRTLTQVVIDWTICGWRIAAPARASHHLRCVRRSPRSRGAGRRRRASPASSCP